MTDDPLLALRDLTATSGGEVVLDGLTFDVRRGERLGVLGERGSGRGAIAPALIGGDEEVSVSGELTFSPDDGDPIDVLALRPRERRRFRWRQVAVVPPEASAAFNPATRVRESFRETLSAHGEDGREGMARARRLLADVGLDAERALGAYPDDLGPEERERAFLALALLLDPPLLVVDRNETALRLLSGGAVPDDERTVVAVDDDPRSLAGVATRLATLYGFDVVELGPTAAILDDAAHPYTRALLRAAFDHTPPPGGEHPEPGFLPGGCPYHPRCPIADEQCAAYDPGRDAVGEAHEAACFYPERAREELPFER